MNAKLAELQKSRCPSGLMLLTVDFQFYGQWVRNRVTDHFYHSFLKIFVFLFLLMATKYC